jgi:hypothetical protein
MTGAYPLGGPGTHSGRLGSVTLPDAVASVWDDVTGVQPTLAERATVATAAVALLLVAVPAAWRLSRHVVTIAHEGAHGVVALLTGRSLSGIRLHSDTSGLTVSRGKPRGPGMVATAFAGYAGPALLGLCGAYLLHRQHALAALWLAVLLLALLLLQIRNFFGLYAVALAGAGVFAVTWWGSAGLQSWAAYVGTWFLLLAAPRPVLELQRLRRRGGARSSDADTLARLTGLPGLVWVGLFLVTTLGCLVLGAGWLLGAAG